LSFLGIDEIKAMLLALVEANIVEDKELGLGAKVRGIGDAGRSQVKFGFFRDVARVAVVALFCHRIDDVRDHHQRGHVGEGIHHVGFRVGNQQHVAFIDGRPTANGRAVHAKAVFKRVLSQLIDRKGYVLPQTWQVREAEVKNLGSVFLREIQDGFCICH
jgi:hypothetical protein